jgi:hypothetical protein
MSTVEIKESIDRMTEEERFFAAAYLHHRAQERDAAYRALLAHRMKRMDDGRKITLKQAKRIHKALEAEGL